MRRQIRQTGGFTLVELMVVLLVTGILMGLLLPALTMVKNTTLKVRQKAQFHTIAVGLEGFRADMGDYPPSYAPYPVDPAQPEVYDYYGAQRLAEALIGQDGFGFSPKSEFRTDGLYDSNGDGTADAQAYDAADEANRKSRKGPYVELEQANAVQLNAYRVNGAYIYNFTGTNALDNYVFADMFRIVKDLRTSKLIGMPNLYYRANTSNYNHTPSTTEADTNIYRMEDNEGIYSNPDGWHPQQNDRTWWYDKTANPAFPPPTPPDVTPYRRPYRAESFLLQSAGPDGLYGTEDDIFNFDDSDK